MRRLLVLLCLVSGCGEPDAWKIRIRLPPEQDPLEGADRLVVRMTTETRTEVRSFEMAKRSLELPLVDRSETVEEITLSAFFEEHRTAFGRIGPLLPSNRHPPPIYFGRVRLFARTEEPPPPGGGFTIATEGGAWVASESGLAFYDHATGRFESGPELDGAEDARFAALDDGGVVAFSGRTAHLLDESGELVPAGDGLPDATDATVVGIPGARALVVGPASVWTWDANTPGEWQEMGTLDPPRVGASATPLVDEGGNVRRVLVAGGRDADTSEPLSDLLLVELDPPRIVEQTTPLGTPRGDHAAVEVRELRGNAWLFGGRTQDGLTDAVEDVIVDLGGRIRTVLRSDPLFTLRAGPAAIGLPGGDILVAGGETDPASDRVLAERFRFQGGGTSVLTGPLPAPIPRAAAAELGDGTILVSGDGAAAIYVPDPG